MNDDDIRMLSRTLEEIRDNQRLPLAYLSLSAAPGIFRSVRLQS